MGSFYKTFRHCWAVAPLALATGLHAETVLRYGISMADIPLTTGQPDRSVGAYQFTDHTLYDPLIAWEANIGSRPGKLIPGLATEWKVDAKQAAQVKPRIPSIASYKKIDDYTVEITDVDALFPYQLPWLLFGSPAQWDKLGRDWGKVALQPSGTGPFRLHKLVPRERADLVRNAGYRDKNRLAETDRIVLMPIPDAVTRANALLNGQVDIIETPPPDVLPQLKASGFKLVQNVTPPVWPYHFSTQLGSPWTESLRVFRSCPLITPKDAQALTSGCARPPTWR